MDSVITAKKTEREKRKEAEEQRRGVLLHSGDAIVMLGFANVSADDTLKLKRICEVIRDDRYEKDFIWNMAMGPATDFHRHWNNIMARCLLRSVRSIPGARQFTLVSKLTEILFGITVVEGLEEVPEVAYDSILEQAKMIESVGIVATTLLGFIETDYKNTSHGNSETPREARKQIARVALFFACLHYDLSFLNLVLVLSSNLLFFDRVAVIGYVRSALFGELAKFVNGSIDSPTLFVSSCITGYTRITNINPYAWVPLASKPVEDPRVLGARYRKVVCSSPLQKARSYGTPLGVTNSQKSRGGMIIGFDDTAGQ